MEEEKFREELKERFRQRFEEKVRSTKATKPSKIKEINLFEADLFDMFRRLGAHEMDIRTIKDRKERIIKAASECRFTSVCMLVGSLSDRLEKVQDFLRERLRAGEIGLEDWATPSIRYQTMVEREAGRLLEDKCGCKFKWPELYPRALP
jgi:hypothetical protein